MRDYISTLCISTLLILITSCGSKQGDARSYNEGINIIPIPQEVHRREGKFELTRSTTIGIGATHLESVAIYFASKMKSATGYDIKIKDEGNIMLVLTDDSSFGEESYRLDITSDSVVVRARTPQGIFYGMQSFMQLLPAEIESSVKVDNVVWEAPAVSIKDSPRFNYRGIHLDPCRHFMTVDEVKKQLDIMAMYKINRMHWHLTDDQGWRIEIKQYPKLTEVGGTRVEGEGTLYGPYYYTQNEVKSIVQYAAERFITIIPELEIPGHELAAIAAYPELSCKGEAITPRTIWGVEDIVLCPGKEEVFTFLQNVIDEMVLLFPGTYFHIGGDECPKNSWKECPLCQERIRKENLKGDKNHTAEELLQSYVVNRIEKYLAGYGKKIIGWDEILEGAPTNTATIMSWRGEEGGIAAAMKGHDAIMSPGPNGLYLDYYQGDSKIEPVAIGGYSPLEKVYGYDPLPDTLVSLQKAHHIIGVQGNTWSEYFYNNDIREYHTYPRALAVSEIAWSDPGRKSFEDFTRRIFNAYVRLDKHYINYHIPLPEQPGGSCNHIAFTDSVLLEFSTTLPLSMVYTTDGTEPDKHSEVYVSPISFTESGILKIASLLPSGKLSGVRTIKVEKQALAPARSVVKSALKQGLEVEVTYGMFLNMEEFKQAAIQPVAKKIIKETRELVSILPSSESMRNVEQYAAVAKGYVEIPEDGVYFFSSNLEEVRLAGKTLINNKNEVKRFSRNDSSIALSKGLHELQVVFLGHIIGGWPSNWNDGSILMRKSDEAEFKVITQDMLWH